MAKAKITATSDFSGLVKDLMELTDSFSTEVKYAADKQLSFFADGIRLNWSTMVPWGHGGDFVSDSIGYNVAFGKSGDIVGMAGVFKLDSVESGHGKTERDMSAPQLAYWAEFGTKNQVGIPFMSNAYYATLDQQDEIFANELDKRIKMRLAK